MKEETNTPTINEEHNDIQKARIEQLLTYMADCQQGIRDLSSQIQTVLTVISTLLTLAFGYSVINALSEDADIGFLLNLPTDTGPLNGRLYRILNAMITIRRINFWLTSAIILIGVLFITALEIEKILRY